MSKLFITSFHYQLHIFNLYSLFLFINFFLYFLIQYLFSSNLISNLSYLFFFRRFHFFQFSNVFLHPKLFFVTLTPFVTPSSKITNNIQYEHVITTFPTLSIFKTKINQNYSLRSIEHHLAHQSQAST